MLLAASGARVRIIERSDQVGGRTTVLERDGFRFDLGPTFFLFPQVLESIFEDCGRSLHEEVDLIRLDPHYRLRFEDGSDLLARPDPADLEREIARLAPADAAGVRRFMGDNRAKLDAFQPILESPFESISDVMRLPLARLLPLMRPWASVDRDLRKYFSDPRVRMAFSFQSKYLGMSPFQCPSLFTILSFIEYEHGIFHPRGGCGELTAAMARVAEQMGVEIRLGEPVRELMFEGRRAVGVRTDQGEYEHDVVLMNADFAQAMTKLVPDRLRRRWTDRKLERKKYSCSTYMMYLGIEGRYDDLEHHTIFLADDYEQNLREIESEHVLSTNPSLYVQNPCVTDPSMAPEGMSSLYVLVPVTHRHPNVDWAAVEPGFRETVYKQLAKIGLGDLRGRVRFEETLTPAGWEHDLQIYRGATFNLAHSLDQMLHLRPRNRFEDLDGVYLVGGGTHPGSGLPVIFESARISSRLALQDLGMPVAWDKNEHAGTDPERPRRAARVWPDAARGTLASTR
jgi:phytoene desaturase